MITTGCEGCCFLKSDDRGKGCSVQQLCALKDGQAFAPGYCRLCRSHKWAQKQTETDTGKLFKKAIEENELKFDLLVFFDEKINSIHDLDRTLDHLWYTPYCKRVIIVDVTGFGKRQNLALQYLNSHEHKVPTVVDSSVNSEPISQRETTVRRMSKQITAPFFMTIPAGKIIGNICLLAKTIQHRPSRVIQWLFPFMMGGTMIIPNKSCYGLFVTRPYKALIRLPEADSFSKQLIKEEAEMEMGLSLLCSECISI